MSLMNIPNIELHNTPSLSTRYCPQVQGYQQTLVSMLMRRQSILEVKTSGESSPFPDEETTKWACSQGAKRSIHACSIADLSSDEVFAVSSLRQAHDVSSRDECSKDSHNESSYIKMLSSRSNHSKPVSKVQMKKKVKQNQGSQLSLRSFFQRSLNSSDGVSSSTADTPVSQTCLAVSECISDSTCVDVNENNTPRESDSNISESTRLEGELDACYSSEKEKRNVALLEWQRIQQLMQNSIPVCMGHKEPCVARVVKKEGPTMGRRFYVCARAEGPASNPEANCGYFKWADSRSKQKGGK